MWQIYDEMGPAFLAHAEHSTYNALYDRPAVLAVAGDVSGLAVLDAGCGPGLYAEALLQRGATVTAIDASEEQLRIARTRLPATTDVRRAVLGQPLPFADASFDLVVCALVIHYVADRTAAFGEFLRVLRPGGRAIVSTQHPTADWLRKGGSYFEVKEEEDVWNTPDGEHRVRFWREPLTTLCAAATESGFMISRLVEPLPDAAMKEQAAEDWDKLHQSPGFLILELQKPPG
jgi:SAM-dependent methyltransferase